LESGAAFGATLYRVLVLFCAILCNVDIESKSFILLTLFAVVQGSAKLCFGPEKRTENPQATRAGVFTEVAHTRRYTIRKGSPLR
jgi:hypothetical protein